VNELYLVRILGRISAKSRSEMGWSCSMYGDGRYLQNFCWKTWS